MNSAVRWLTTSRWAYAMFNVVAALGIAVGLGALIVWAVRVS